MTSSERLLHFFARARARLKNRRNAGLSFFDDQTPLNGMVSVPLPIGRNSTSGKQLAIVASLVRLTPKPRATK